MHKYSRMRRGQGVGLCALLVLAALLLPWPKAGAGPAAPVVAVVDFYALSPVGPIAGVVPEWFAADDLSRMLAQAGVDRLTVLPRGSVQQAERDLAWRDADVLRYARLSALAERLHADRLVVGWIRQLTLGLDSHSVDFPSLGGGPILASAVVVVQIFDAAQGRIVAQTQTEGDAIGSIRPFLAETVLHRALVPAVGRTLDSLTVSTP